MHSIHVSNEMCYVCYIYYGKYNKKNKQNVGIFEQNDLKCYLKIDILVELINLSKDFDVSIRHIYIDHSKVKECVALEDIFEMIFVLNKQLKRTMEVFYLPLKKNLV